jgi:hypothetical protein
MSSNEADAYIREVMGRLPRSLPWRGRIDSDLRLHMGELMVAVREGSQS